ncbi:MAG: hypothetical protein ACRCZY_03500, partial [Phocaeicola sp.]
EATRGKTYTAKFISQYTIVFESSNTDLGTVDKPGGTGDSGTFLESTAKAANENCRFVGWYVGNEPVVAGDDITITGNKLEVTLTAETGGKTYTAKFEAIAPGEFIFTIKTKSAGTSYRLPFVSTSATGDYELTVDWGDGTPTLLIPKGTSLVDGITHTYESAKEYTITITSSEKDYTKAQMPMVRWENDNRLHAINAPLLNTAATSFSSVFKGCYALTSIPEGLFKYNTAATSFSSVFNGCSSLTSIPEGLFKYNTAVTSFSSVFYRCRYLTSIPEGLFANNTAVTSFEYAFYDCTSLTEIPAGLFVNNTAVTGFRDVFYKCSSLTEIPAGLFATNTAVTSFTSVFYGCTSLTSIPAGLFANNTAVTSFSFAFYNCYSLAEIPGGLFATNTAVTSFEYAFKFCKKAKVNSNIFCNDSDENERKKRFSLVTSQIDFEHAFFQVGSGLSDVSGSAFPALWDYTMPSAGVKSASCFTEARASNSGSVPGEWK